MSTFPDFLLEQTMSVLGSFRLMWHNLVHLSEGAAIKETASIKLDCRQGCKAFFSLKIDGRRPSPFLVVPSLNWWSWLMKKAGWATYEKEALKLHPSIFSASTPVSRTFPLCIPALISFDDEQRHRSVSKMNPFFPKLY